MMGLWRISVLLYVISWASHTQTVGSEGQLKELVYRDVVTTQMDLVARPHAACTTVDPAVLRHVMTAIPRCAQACLNMHGGHFEHLP
ncbi:uncharacterized protein TNCV_5094471 [Trichonephila clavipes]|nr:uncharacterized protein TNCV_5094471 [Trichonephila clavipes]